MAVVRLRNASWMACEMGPLWAVMPEGVSAVLALKAGPLRGALVGSLDGCARLQRCAWHGLAAILTGLAG